MSLNDLRDKAYKNAVAHGWHEEELSNEHCLCLVISELMEAVEADRKNRHAKRKFFNHSIDYGLRELHLKKKDFNNYFCNSFNDNIKDSVEDELADTCIRILDLAGLRDINLSYIDDLMINQVSFTEYIYAVSSFISNPYKTSNDWLERHLSDSLGWIFSFCKKKNIDILWHIEQKMKYNELRPYKHGNKTY